MLKCPLCPYTSETLIGIRTHAIKTHVLDRCPVCGRKYKDLLSHFERQMEKCEEHRKLYAIFCTRTRHKWVFDWAEKALQVGDQND